MFSLLKKLEGFERPSAMKICSIALVSYFVVTSGIAYDLINEPPGVGLHTDAVTGAVRPVTFMPFRLNGQYIVEGFAGGFFFTLGGLGIIMLDQAHNRKLGRRTRGVLHAVGTAFMLLAYGCCMAFIRIKMPDYLREES